MRTEFRKLSEKEETVGRAVVDAAFRVHKGLGPGLLEKVYEVCFCHELGKAGLACERQIPAAIQYDGIRFEEGFRLDVLVEGSVVCEIKAVDQMNPVFLAQLLSYLKLTGKRLRFLINFNAPTIKAGIKRVIL